MPSTTRYNRGAVVLVRFPFTDLQGSKQRPALVVSAEEYALSGADVILAAISSSRFANPGPFDHPIGKWQSAGLLHPSVVRAGKIVTLDRGTIRRVIGRISRKDLAAVDGKLGEALGLAG